ncbi:MAG: hypothetical protein Tp152SUR359831_43 [Prokaryotic dsDNA virus sp.]|nr:MAG: hypothetical protein Tp152SUR359831_43 [Prokaryotic dsDNA virus sp.]|tara:strand:- start:1780 stop:4521 length:2742 start_codon:yes stop_codon:yes gene_type:complete
MSTQLILYPQNYTGYSYSSSLYIQEFVNDPEFNGSFFGTIQNAVYNSAGFNNFMATAPPISGWKGFHSNSGTGWYNNTSAPTISGGVLTLHGTNGPSSVGSICGVYQKISGLTIGQSYELVVDHPTGTGLNQGIFAIGGFGTHTFHQNDFIGQVPNQPVGSSPTITSNVGTSTTFTFTATNTEMNLLFSWLSSYFTGTVEITKISVKESNAVPQLVFDDINDGQVICDLYQEQDIPLTLSVDEFTNIIEKQQSYSKDFDLPATKRNNQIFTHIFEITKSINNVFDFNPYKQTKASLKQNGVLLFEGCLRLIEIVQKNGEISYNVNLFSESIALAEVLQGKTFSDLTSAILELEHQYTEANIINSFTGNLELVLPLSSGSFAGNVGDTTTDVLKYPFVNWTGNIDCTGSEPVVEQLTDVFRPFIKVKYLIQNIFKSAGFSFTSQFINSSFFDKLYMDFNSGADGVPETLVDHEVNGIGIGDETQFLTTSFTNLILSPQPLTGMPSAYNQTTNQYVSPFNNNVMNVNVNINLLNTDTSDRVVEYQVLSKGVVISSGSATILANLGQIDFTDTFTDTLNATDIIEVQIKADVTNKVRVKQDFVNFVFTTSVHYNSSSISGTISSTFSFNALRGDIEQWEFIKSIMTMFNLITLPDPSNPNNILIEPYVDVFGNDPTAVTPTQLDWTYKLDTSNINIKPIELKQKITFKYAEDEDDYAFNVYKKATSGFLYGSKVINNTTYSLVEGEEEIEPKVFSATVCKPIEDLFPNFFIPVIYSGSLEEGMEAFDNNARILIDCGTINQNYEVDGSSFTQYLAFAHVDTIPCNGGDIDINFGECQLFLGTSPTDNLFNTYYLEYYNHLYDPNTRILKAKVNLTPTDINTFKFYDIVTLKNRKYRVNKIDYKPNALSTVEFILLN